MALDAAKAAAGLENNSDNGAYNDEGGNGNENENEEIDERNNNSLSMEESKTYEEFKSKVTDQPFYGSDAEAYSESDDGADG